MSHPPINLLVRPLRRSRDDIQWSRSCDERPCLQGLSSARSSQSSSRRAARSRRNSFDFVPMCVLPKARGGENMAPVPMSISAARDLAFAKATRLRAERLQLQEAQRKQREPDQRAIEIVAPSYVLPRTMVVHAARRLTSLRGEFDIPPAPFGEAEYASQAPGVESLAAEARLRSRPRARSAESPPPIDPLPGGRRRLPPISCTPPAPRSHGCSSSRVSVTH